MLTLDEIQKALEGCDLTAVAFHTGLHFNTIRRYRDGRITDPPLDTVQKLSEYLTEGSAKKHG